MPRPNHDKEILACLRNSSSPMSATQLQKLLSVNKSTIYRRLESLSKKKVIKPIILANGKTFFEIYSEHHHHHLFCEKCHHIEDVTLISEAALLTEIMGSSRFRVKSHMIEFVGICQNCQ